MKYHQKIQRLAELNATEFDRELSQAELAEQAALNREYMRLDRRLLRFFIIKRAYLSLYIWRIKQFFKGMF